MIDEDKLSFAAEMNNFMSIVHDNAVKKGFHSSDVPIERILLRIHSEISELDEALRDGNPDSVKAEGFSCAEEECADVIIRLAELCRKMEWDLAGAILAKVEYNAGRPYLHGRKT